MAKHPKKWVDFIMRFELGLERPDKHRAHQSALVIGLSYVLGGIIPIGAYFFFSSHQIKGYFTLALSTLYRLLFSDW